MIRTFRGNALAALWAGELSKIDQRFHARIVIRLDRLNAALVPKDMDHPGYRFHPLLGHKPTRYSVHVNGPWCLTFEFDDGDAYAVDFEQYH